MFRKRRCEKIRNTAFLTIIDLMPNTLKPTAIGLVVGGTGLAMVTAACAVYKAFKDSQPDEGERKHINVRHLRAKMEDYSYGKELRNCQ